MLPDPRYRGLTELCLFRCGVKRSNVEEELLITSLNCLAMLHLPHGIVVRIHANEIDIVALIPKWWVQLVRLG